MRAEPSTTVSDLVGGIRSPDGASATEIQARLDDLTKPRGSLGRLEEAASFLARILGCPPPSLEPRAVFVLAGDHGVTERGVSAYPPEVTVQMCRNIGEGGAAVSVLARRVGAKLVVADLGVRTPVEHPAVLDRNVVRGTRDLAREPALSATEVERAIMAGAGLVADEAAEARLIAIGEMGIGNTTAAAAVTAALLDLAPGEVVGPGSGVGEAGLERKRRALELALGRIPREAKPLDVLAEVGGAEIVGLVGVILEGARRRVPVVLDGFISTAAALAAVRLAPQAASYLIASHRSAEPGHALQLEALWLEPLLDLGLRLGEGSGAMLAIPILDAAADILRDMATFSSAQISPRSASEPVTS